MRERRLGSRRRREPWDYAEIFSVTLTLVWWSVLYRMLWTTSAIWFTSDLDVGWLRPESRQLPILPVLAWMLVGLAIMNAGCFLEPRNRTRAALALTAMNLAFIASLGFAVFLHLRFALEQSAHRASHARSDFNLAREISGRWEVVARDEPAGGAHFPARGLWFGREGWQGCFVDPEPALVGYESNVEAIDAFRPSTSLFEDLAQIWFGNRDTPRFDAIRVEGADYQPPAVVLHTWTRAPASSDTPDAYVLWVADLREVLPEELTFRAIDPVRPAASASAVRVRHPEKPRAGYDFARELARDECAR